MKRTALALTLAVLPVTTFALDFQHGDDDYTDTSRFSVAERAAISVLSEMGAVSGNPDGSFAAHRTLNRAEFTKIAVNAAPPGRVLESDLPKDPSPVLTDPWCFPDVRKGDWFSPFVCAAKESGIVQGNPDGLFHPERAVNYAEAVKILVELADYALPVPAPHERWAWYTGYMRAADENGVALPGDIDASHELTRGQMARLAAAFVAEREGTLEVYRNAEQGDFSDVASSSSSSSSSSLQISVSSISSSSQSSVSSVALYPAKNSFFLTGKRSPLLLGGTFTSQNEASIVRRVQLTLRREVPAIDSVYVVDKHGATMIELNLATSDNVDKRKWEASLPMNSLTLDANIPTKLGVVFLLKPKDTGGGSNQLIETETFFLQTETLVTAQTQYLFTETQLYPVHQTSYGRLTRVTSTLPTTGAVQAGAQRRIADVRIHAETASGGAVRLLEMSFAATMSNVSLSKVKIGDASKNLFADCGVYMQDGTVLACLVPEGLSTVPENGMNVSVYADVALQGNTNGQFMIELQDRGRMGDGGSVRWTDSAGTFTWIEENVPFGGGVSWTVVP